MKLGDFLEKRNKPIWTRRNVVPSYLLSHAKCSELETIDPRIMYVNVLLKYKAICLSILSLDHQTELRELTSLSGRARLWLFSLWVHVDNHMPFLISICARCRILPCRQLRVPIDQSSMNWAYEYLSANITIYKFFNLQLWRLLMSK